MKPAFFAIVVLAGAVLLLQVPRRGIDPDELMHMHAACAVSWGEVPYRDFFEHHGPALYYLLQPILRVTGTELPALWYSRLLMWAVAMATIAVTGLIAGRLAGSIAAATATALLSCTTVFFQKAIEVRPDGPAMFLITLAVYVMLARRQSRSAWASLAAGFLLGLATLFTQKAIVPAAGLVVAEMVALWQDRRFGPGDAARIGLMGLGGLAAWSIAAGLFWTADGADTFFHSTICQLWQWPVRHSPWSTLRPMVSADFSLWVAAALTIVAFLHELRRASAASWRAIVPSVVLVSFVGGLFLQAAYTQYYLLYYPLLAVVAADGLLRLAASETMFRSRRTWFCVLAAVVAIEAALAARAMHGGPDGALPHLLARFPLPYAGLLVGGLLVALAATALAEVVRGHRFGIVFGLVALGLGYAALRNLDAICWSNRSQVAAITEVDSLVGVDETVLDGYTGFGAFRRHAYYYWWLNRYSLRLMTPEAQGPELLAHLEQSPPKLICFDENIQSLPSSMRTWIERNYTSQSPPLYIRRKTAGTDH